MIPNFYKSHIYPIDSIPGRPQAHASTITQLEDKDGNVRIFTVWFCGTREGHIDVAIESSIISYPRRQKYEDVNNIQFNYSKPKIIADIPDRAIGNPIVAVLPDKKLHFWYAPLSPKHRKPESILYKMSGDDGETWTDPIHFEPSEGIWPRNIPIVLKSGRIILPLNDELTRDKKYKTNWSSGFAISDDNGKTWVHTDYIFSKKGCIQPSIAEKDNGDIYCIMRGRKGFAWQSISKDQGEIWSEPEKTKITNPNSNIVLTKLDNGDFLMVCNPTKKGRKPISLFLSKDQGISWDKLINLEPSPFHNAPPNDMKEFSYPCIIQTDDGLIHITYTYGRRTIEHIVINNRQI